MEDNNYRSADDSRITGRGHSRARGESRSRSASRGASSRRSTSSNYGSERSTSSDYGTGRKSYSEKSKKSSYEGSRSSNRRNGSDYDDNHNGIIVGAIIFLCVLVVGGFFLMKSGLIGGGNAKTEESDTAIETTAFDGNVISKDLYIDYSSLSKDATPVNLKGMNAGEVKELLKKSYNWSLAVANKNPSLDSFTMPEIPTETVAEDAAETGADNEGTVEVVEVDNPLKNVTIRPEKGSYALSDLISPTIDTFVDGIFTDYQMAGIAGAATTEATEAEKTEAASDASSESATQSVDYTFELEDMTSTITDEMNQLALVWDMKPVNGDITSYNKETGEFVFGGSSEGYQLDAAATAQAVMAKINSGDFSGTVDGVGNAVSSSSDSIKDKYKTIGSFTTKTTSNSVRNKNIKLAAAAINGTVLQPGQEFSFNGTVGQRTEAKGYGGAPAYNNGEVVQEVGGGVCQVSTTLYNAVFRAGLTSTYRRSHTFAPSYVTPGMDATVSYPSPDYKFVNNSSNSIGIRASYSDQTVTVSIYGVRILPEGVTWELTSEKVRDLPMPAVKIITSGSTSSGSTGSEWQSYKIITTNGKVEKVKDHYTSYVGHTPTQYAQNQPAATEAAATTAPVETTPVQTVQETSVAVAPGPGAGPGGSSTTQGSVSAPNAPTSQTQAAAPVVETTTQAAVVEAPGGNSGGSSSGNSSPVIEAPGGNSGGDSGAIEAPGGDSAPVIVDSPM